MARSIKEIYDEAAAEKASMSTLNELLVNPDDGSSTLDSSQKLLSDLTSPSRVAIWRLMLWVHAAITHFQERLWDVFKTQLEAIVSSATPGTRRWYQREALRFQYGHELMWDGNKYAYSSDTPSARIITRCSVADPTSLVRIKVAKGVGPTILSPTEEAAFAAYMNKIKFAGTNLVVVNLPADLLRLQIDVYVDPLVDFVALRQEFESAITLYLASLPFDGVLRRSAIMDRLQGVQGVVDVAINICEAKSTTFPTYQPIELEYSTEAGYVVIDPAYPLGGYADSPINSLPVINIMPHV